MNTKKKILSAALCASILLLSACSGGEDGGNVSAPSPAVTTTESLDNEIDYDSMADIGEVDSKNEDGTGSAYETGKLAGEVKALCYYDIGDQAKDVAEVFATRFGRSEERRVGKECRL